MLKSHKNSLLGVIQQSGLSPSLFQAEEVMLPTRATEKRLFVRSEKPAKPPSSLHLLISKLFGIESASPDVKSAPLEVKERCFVIKIRNTPLNFTLIPSESTFDYYGYRFTQFKPKYPEHPSPSPVSFASILRIFAEWIKYTVEVYLNEENTPDLWLQIETYQSFVDEPSTEDRNTSNFTEEEKKDVYRSVEEFKRLVAENFSPTKKQQEYINKELDYLSNAVDRLNRFDWRGLAISTLMGIAINLSVDSEKGRLLFKLFQQAFQTGLKLLQ